MICGGDGRAGQRLRRARLSRVHAARARGWQSTEAQHGGVVQVQLLGAFRVELPNGKDAAPWARPSGRRLFQALLLRERRRIGREEVAQLLFPDRAPERAANAVSKALSIARAALAPFDLIKADRNVIWIDGPIEVDLDVACSALRRGLSLPPGEDREEALIVGLAFEGSLLDQELYADWPAAGRMALEALRRDAGLALARNRSAGHGRRSVDLVIDAWRQVHVRDSSNEEAASALMAAYGGRGQRDQVVGVFRRTVAAIRELGLQAPERLTASYVDALEAPGAVRKAASSDWSRAG